MVGPFKSENYRKNIDEKPSGFIGKFFNTLKKIFKTGSIKNLPKNSSQDATIPHRRDSDYGSSLDEGSEYEEISNYQEKIGENLPINPQSPEQSKEEPIYATVSPEHIEEKRKHTQKQQQKPPISPKPSIAPPVPKKTPGAYISHDAPDVNWGSYPGKVKKVMEANNIPPSPQPRTQKPKEEPIYVNTSQGSETKPPLAPKPRTSKATPATKMSTEENRVKKIVERFEAGKVKGPGG